jgi:hypothetical protein
MTIVHFLSAILTTFQGIQFKHRSKKGCIPKVWIFQIFIILNYLPIYYTLNK